MKRSTHLGVFSFVFFACAATTVVAAPAPVTSINTTNALIGRLERQMEIRNKIQIDMQDQLVSLLREVDELRGQLEKNQYDLRRMQDVQRDLYKEIDELKQKKTVTNASKPQQSINPVIFSDNAAENTQYNAAVDRILKNKDYAGAMTSFEEFITQYPDSVYAPNVFYWLGQLNLTKGDLNLAKQHFTKVISYNDANKKAEALLKLAVIATRQNDTATATKFYNQVVVEYPGTPSATEAKNALN